MTWLAILIIAGGVAAGAVTLVLAMRRAKVAQSAWKPLTLTVFAYSAPPGFDDGRLSLAANEACDALALVWSHGSIGVAFRGWRLHVNDANDWVNAKGVRVAGESYLDLGVSFVGRDLKALAHELAHVAQDRIDHIVDYAHTGWDARGINAAVATYEAWLRGQG